MTLVGCLMLLSGCDAEKPVEGGELVHQYAQLNTVVDGKLTQTSPYKLSSLVLKTPETLTQEVSLAVSLYKPAESDLTAKIAVAQDEVKSYQEKYGTTYDMLPSEMIAIPGEMKVKKGSLTSEAISVMISLPADFPMNKPYIFGIKLSDVSGSSIQLPNNVAIYTIERYEESIEVTKAVRLTRNDYFKPTKPFGDQGQSITMETLVYVEKFRSPEDQGEAQISTLMGVEGGTLLRFGDASVPGNHLQAAGTDIGYTFQPNRWYHIAFVAEKGKVTVYVNGSKVISYGANVSLSGNWLIGQSWSGNRGIQARLAEVRVWKVARTQAQIQDGMFLVAPNSEGLLAYWKMNAADGTKVSDLTGNGYDLIIKGQGSGRDPNEPVNVLTLDDPISID